MKKIHLLKQFKEAVQTFPQQTAVLDDNRSVTYVEFDAHSNMVAAKLKSSGVSKGSRVGILGKRSSYFIEGFMGILKLGAVYVPLDPAYPLPRLKYMILSSGIRWILADRSIEPIIRALKEDRVDVEILFLQSFEDMNYNPLTLPDLSLTEEDTAVILFTSGSTGEPKGVELTYAGYVNNFSNMQSIFQFNKKTKIAHIASPCFDISLTELWMPLLYGGTICVASDEVKKNPWLLSEWIEKHQIDTIQFVPSLFHHFLLAHEEAPLRLSSIMHLLLLGEGLRTSLVKKWFQSFASETCLVYNLYGPVEASIETTCYKMSITTQIPGDNVPIGKPFKGVDFYIFDSNQQPVTEPDQEGTLMIGGPQLAKGYLNPQQTEKAFILHPTFGRIYNTGDIVKKLTSGDFLYLGRNDRQVKIRGFRIEIPEIEEALSRCQGVKHAAVIADKSSAEAPVLIGFVTGSISSTTRLKDELSTKLPHFMIPQRIVLMDSIPLNSNGKTDYKALQTHG